MYLATFACNGNHNDTLTLKPTKKINNNPRAK